MQQPVFDFVARMKAKFDLNGPVLEVGSYVVRGQETMSVRKLFEGVEYIGIDMRDGPGVDYVMDICDPIIAKRPIIPAAASLEPYRTVLCLETMEHVRWPWIALKHMRGAMDADSLLVLTWVFNFPIHDYPDDYWRITPKGLRMLLDTAGFDVAHFEIEGGPAWDPTATFVAARPRPGNPYAD